MGLFEGNIYRKHQNIMTFNHHILGFSVDFLVMQFWESEKTHVKSRGSLLDAAEDIEITLTVKEQH